MNTFVEDIWRKWDRNAARKLDRIVAISNVVKDRIKKYYDLDADVIYTPVDVTGISKASKGFNKENWYLY